MINRVEFTDGTFWQRQGWDVNDLKLVSKARSETRNLPMCRVFETPDVFCVTSLSILKTKGCVLKLG